jgi:3-oxoacyl-[acyl-carrier-protein] synthase II
MPAASISRYTRVAVRAWDCLSAAGDAERTWSACSSRRSALRHIEAIGWCGPIAEVPERMALSDIAAAAAAKPWKSVADVPGRIAWSISSSKGNPAALMRAVSGSASELTASLPGQLQWQLAKKFGLNEFVPQPVAAACSTGLYAVLGAADLIERGLCMRGLAGSADASLQPFLLAGFAALGVLCGAQAPRAFAEPTGFAPAEGAGFLALAHDGPWRLVAGVRLGDAGHETQFTDPATLRACLDALWAVAPRPDLIVAHGTGTGSGDAYERLGYASGPWSGVPLMACKPIIGHCLGASGSVELAAALEAPVQRLWKLSLGFGGHLAAVALERAER